MCQREHNLSWYGTQWQACIYACLKTNKTIKNSSRDNLNKLGCYLVTKIKHMTPFVMKFEKKIHLKKLKIVTHFGILTICCQSLWWFIGSSSGPSRSLTTFQMVQNVLYWSQMKDKLLWVALRGVLLVLLVFRST